MEFADRLIGEAGQFTVRPVTRLDVIVTDPTKLNVLLSEIAIDAPVAPPLKFVGVRAAKANPPTWIMVDVRWVAVPGEPEPVTLTT